MQARSYPGLDLVRLAAALMVALFHFGYWDRPSLGLQSYQWADWGWCGVEIFFVISGFVIAFSASRKDAKSFIISRAGRLYPAAWICATISVLVSPVSLLSYLGSLALSPVGPWVNGVYWTLAVEIAFYALISLALWRRWSLHAIALLLGGFSTICWSIRCLGFVLPVGPYGHYGCYFALGMLLFERRSLLASAIFFIAGNVGVYFAADHYGFGYTAPIVWSLATLLCAAAVFRNDWVISFARSWPTRTLGLMTYPLYLIHDSVGPPFLRFGIAASISVSLLVAFAILPLESIIRRSIFSRIRDRLATGQPL